MHSIVEVCRKAGLSSRTLRVWEGEGLIVSSRDANGMRYFNQNVFDEISKIQKLKEFGFSLKDVGAILNGRQSAVASELLSAKRREVEEQALKLSDVQSKLAQVEELLSSEHDRIDYLASPEVLIERFTTTLLSKSRYAKSEEHHCYLKAELAHLGSAEIIKWLAALKKVIRYARENDVPLRFVRGYAASSLVLHLLGWTEIDPCAEGLLPHNPSWQALHFDVPYLNTEHFFEFLARVNKELCYVGFVAFRLPILDLISQFAEAAQTDPFDWEPEARLIGLLREGCCERVYGLDESGNSLINRIYPELSEEKLSSAVVAKDLMQFGIQNKEDLLRFLALRRSATWDLFENYLSGKATSENGCALAKILPEENRGYVFFREEMLKAVQKATHWDWRRIAEFRRCLRNKTIDAKDLKEFIAATDEQSLAYFEYWDARYFHKSHLVSQWQLIATTLTCIARAPQIWNEVTNRWEREHSLRWNDFGVIWKDAKLLTPL